MFLALGIVLCAVAASPLLVLSCGRRTGWVLGAAIFGAFAVFTQHIGQSAHLNWINDFGGVSIGLDFQADPLSSFFALIALGVGGMVMLYSAEYQGKTGNMSFYVIMTAFLASVLVLVLADNVVLLFIAWELVSIGSFLLIARAGSGGEAGSTRTLILTYTGGVFLLVAVGIMITVTGSANLHLIIASPAWQHHPAALTVTAVLIALAGFSKAAQFPFHFWLPEAMAAATPVSAFLHAAAVVKAGVYLLLRFSPLFQDNALWHALLIVVGMSTAVFAAIFALQKTDLKKLTAYSTVSHLGWIVATIGIGTPVAFAAALVHTLTHALFKSSLFMLIGVVDHATHTRDIRRLGKIYDKMPFTFAGMVIAALNMAAVPPTLGFISKEGMLDAFTEAPGGTMATVALLVAAAIGATFTFLYSAKLVLGAFVDGPRDLPDVKEQPWTIWLPAALPGLLSIPALFFLHPASSAITTIVGTLRNAAEYTNVQLTHEFHYHLSLWHGITIPFLVSVFVLVAGVIGTLQRRTIAGRLEGKKLLPYSGNELLHQLLEAATKWGRLGAELANSFAPSRHLQWMLFLVVCLAAGGTYYAAQPGVLQPRHADFWPGDLIPLTIITLGVFGLVTAKKRFVGVALLGMVGVGVTLQIFMLGAPDVALTQFLVEILATAIMMMVVRRQPGNFRVPGRNRKIRAITWAILCGLAASGAVWALYGRRTDNAIARWYLDEAPEVGGAHNIVNLILVEFRGFDTMGELTVLGMAGVVITAVVLSVPRMRGETLQQIRQAELNSVVLRTLTKIAAPLLGVAAFLIFMRGHNAPGGGFIAALVAGGAIFLGYLAKPVAGPIVKPNTPYLLTGIGVLFALGAGFLGLTHGSFLYAIHAEWLGQHWSSAMIFDFGVFLSVLGMITGAINTIGGRKPAGKDDVWPGAAAPVNAGKEQK